VHASFLPCLTPNILGIIGLLFIFKCLIGIEIGKVDYSLELSTKLSKDFNSICERVLAAILNLVKMSKAQIVS
ncbi:MAG: hypothetical protein ACRC68_11140, partial [Clostridium sp.]